VTEGAARDIGDGGRAHAQVLRRAGSWFTRLLVVAWTAQFVSSAVRPLIIFRTLDTGAGPFQVGLVAAAFSAFALVAAIPLGKAVDRRGETGFLVMGGALVTVTLVALLAPATLVTLAVCSASLGLGHLSLVAASQTLIAKGAAAEVRESRFAWLTSVNATAQIVGPAVTGLLIGGGGAAGSGAAGFRGDLVVALAASFAAVAVLTSVSLRRWPGALVRRVAAEPPPQRGSFAAVLRLPHVPTAMLASLTVLTCVDLLGTYVPVLGHEIGLSPRTIGLLLALEGVAAMVVRFWMLPLITRFSRRRVLVTTMLLAAVSVSTIPLWAALERPLPGMVLAMLVCGLGLGIGQPATMAWVASTTPPPLRGTAVGIRLSGNRLGLILVPIGAGALASSVGLAAAFWLPAVFLLISAALVLRTR